MGGGVNSYVRWLVPRIRECHRLLSENGSLFLHLDYKSSHYLKIELDKIFGRNNFINEIVWHYTGGGRSKNYFSRKHDSILWYSKQKNKQIFNINKARIPYNKNSGYAKSGIKSKSGKIYKPNPLGTPVDDVWNIPIINPMSPERIGYPTQKPLFLLNRIIECCSKESSVIADFFCGCGTTVSATQNLNRQWLGCDISKDAIKVIRERMAKEHQLKIEVINTDQPTRAQIYRLNPFEFEKKMVEMLGGTPNHKQVSDGGIDGRMHDWTPIQVKKSDKVGRPVIDSFYKHVKEGNGKGIIIAKSFSKSAYEEADRLFNKYGLQIDLVPSDDIIRDAA